MCACKVLFILYKIELKITVLARLLPYWSCDMLLASFADFSSYWDYSFIQVYNPCFIWLFDSIRNTTETNNGDRRFLYGHQYHAPQLPMDRDVTRVGYTPGYYSQRLSPTTSHSIPLSQAGSSAYHPQNMLPSYHLQNRLPSPYHSQNRLPSAHRPYYPVVTSQDQGSRLYAGSSQGPASGNLSYGDPNLPISSYYYS